MCFAPRAQNHGIYDVFFASGSKNHGICSVDWPAPSKNTGIYVVFSMLQEELVPCQRRKIHCKLQCFGSSQAPKNSKKNLFRAKGAKSTVNYNALALRKHQKTANIRQKVPKIGLAILPPFFFPPRTPKNVKTPPE